MDEPDGERRTQQDPPKRRLPPVPQRSGRELLRDPLGYFTSLTRQYGDIVCYRPAPETAYLLNHPDYVKHVLVDNNRNYSKATYSNQVFKKVIGDGLITAEGEAWRRQRRLMQPAFHHTRVQRLDGLIVEAAQAMLEKWQQYYEQGQPVDMAREMAGLTLTVTTRALFGVNLGERVKQVGEIVNRAALFFEKPNNPAVRQSSLEFRAVVDEIIRERKRDFQDTGDLLSAMMQARDETGRAGWDDEQLRDQLSGLLLAGYETTANALTWTWYLLSQNPWAVERLRGELQGRLAGRAPRYADLEGLPYLRRVLDESLRLYPPAWILGRRAIGEDSIGGYYVAPGTVLAISIYTLHRHPAFWENPEDFDPQRFAPAIAARRHKYAYIPFGGGPRQCIGNNFGLLEAGLIIACVAQRFEPRLVPGTEVQPQAIFVLRPKRDLLMSLHA
ncbi:MAG TPA: cytochrome P450 [Anaerolineales bacterium]|nr:cytochrome P450 [Anaerolineales bacterium]